MGAQATVSRVGIAMVASAALVLGFVTPVQAEDVEPAPVVWEPGELPSALESSAAEPVKPEHPEGDFEPNVNPLAEIVESNDGEAPLPAAEVPAVEDFDLAEAESVERSEFANDYVFDDGYGVAELGREPLNVLDTDGEWRPVSLSAAFGGDVWSADRHPLSPEFPETLGEGNSLTVSEAAELFRKDMEKFSAGVRKAFNVPLTQQQFDAAVSFHFNTGAIDRADDEFEAA